MGEKPKNATPETQTAPVAGGRAVAVLVPPLRYFNGTVTPNIRPNVLTGAVPMSVFLPHIV